MERQDQMISVIVPVYNVKPYLNEFMESVVGQTYTNLEIILIDDGSSDGSSTICDTWAERDFRVLVIHQENKGVSAARNVGLNHATGELIAFADSDDVLHPQFYELLADALMKNHAQMSACLEQSFDETEKVFPKSIIKPCMVRIMYRQEMMERLLGDFIGQITWTVNKVYTRELIGKKRFVEMRTMEDTLFSTDIVCEVERVAWIDERLYYYRQRKTSAMNQYNPGVFLDYMKSYEYIYEKLTENGSPDMQSRNLYKYLNRLANLKAKAYCQKEKEIYHIIMKKFNETFDENKSRIKDKKEYLKLILARRFRFAYDMIKG